jgi:hypothetical protein
VRIRQAQEETLEQPYRRLSRDLSALSRIAWLALDLDDVDRLEVSGSPVRLGVSRRPLLVKVSRHLSAVIDGVRYDTHNCSCSGTRCVYRYFSLKP